MGGGADGEGNIFLLLRFLFSSTSSSSEVQNNEALFVSGKRSAEVNEFVRGLRGLFCVTNCSKVLCVYYCVGGGTVW